MRQVRGFQIGEVLSAAIAVYGQNLRTLVVFALVTYSPVIALMAFYPLPDLPALPMLSENPEQNRQAIDGLWPSMRAFYETVILYTLVASFSYCWMVGGATYLVVRTLRSNPPTLRQTLWQSARAIPRLILVTVLVTLATAFATLLFIVPGIIVMVMLWVAMQAAVVERRYSSALRRSYHLTLGHKLPVFGLAILLMVFGFACTMVVPAIVSDLAPRLAAPAEAVASAAAASINAVVGAVCYHDLRVLKEGGNSSVVAKVFE